MTTGVLITAIIVGGVVMIALIIAAASLISEFLGKGEEK